MRQPYPTPPDDRGGPASDRAGAQRGDDAQAGAGELRALLARLCEDACVVDRLCLATHFARFAARADIAEGVRRQALRAVQDLATRKAEEAPCVRGLEVMKVRIGARAKR